MMGPFPKKPDAHEELLAALGLTPEDMVGEKDVTVTLPQGFDQPPTAASVVPRRVMQPSNSTALSEPSTAPVVDSTVDQEMLDAKAADRTNARNSHFQQAGLNMAAGFLNRAAPYKAPIQPTGEAASLSAMRKAATTAALEKRKVDVDERKAAAEGARALALDQRGERWHQDSQENAKAVHEDSQANAEAMRGLAAGNQGIAKSHLAISQEESARKKQEKADKEGAAVTDFLGGRLVPRRPGLSDTVVNETKKAARAYSAALNGMDGLEQSIREYVAHPDINTKNNITSRVAAVAGALNGANEQGAMTEGELKTMKDALGASVVSPEGIMAVMGSVFGENPAEAAKVLLAKLGAARSAARSMSLAKFSTDFDFVPGAGSVGSRRIATNNKTGERRYINDDGTLGEVAR